MNTDLMFSSKSDIWATPKNFFNSLNAEFNFTLDPCALPENAKCKKFYTPEQNGLNQDWSGEIVFCNPPYSDIKSGVEKASNETKNGAKTVLLIPSRTDTRYFHDFIWDCKEHKPRPNVSELRFIKGRLKFGDSKNAAPFPSMVVVFS